MNFSARWAPVQYLAALTPTGNTKEHARNLLIVCRTECLRKADPAVMKKDAV